MTSPDTCNYQCRLCGENSDPSCLNLQLRNELPHDKTSKMTDRPVKTQISLDICPVWSEFSLCTQRVAKDPSFLHADSEDSDLTGQMPRLIWVFAGHAVILLVLSWGSSNGLRQANLVLIAYASSGGSGEPAHRRSLARTSAARSYKHWVKRNLQTESQIPGPSEWLGMRS